MSALAPRPRLATDHGRCVIRLSKEQRLASEQVADAARLKRALAEIYLDGVHAYSEAMVAERVVGVAFVAMAVLVAASPCALALATPSAVLAGVARAARAGVLVKGGAPLETLGRVTSIAFDKTGTLTWGEPRVTDTVAASSAPGTARSARAKWHGLNRMAIRCWL